MTKKKQHCIHECVCGMYELMPCAITDKACTVRCKHTEFSLQSADDVQFSERELIHIDTILTLHAIEHLPKECNCPECISIHKKIAELRKGGRE